jgi:hypothetical protein
MATGVSDCGDRGVVAIPNSGIVTPVHQPRTGKKESRSQLKGESGQAIGTLERNR